MCHGTRSESMANLKSFVPGEERAVDSVGAQRGASSPRKGPSPPVIVDRAAGTPLPRLMRRTTGHQPAVPTDAGEEVGHAHASTARRPVPRAPEKGSEAPAAGG